MLDFGRGFPGDKEFYIIFLYRRVLSLRKPDSLVLKLVPVGWTRKNAWYNFISNLQQK